jgi:hypothetical protein
MEEIERKIGGVESISANQSRRRAGNEEGDAR